MNLSIHEIDNNYFLDAEDLQTIQHFNKTSNEATFIHTDVIPEPFIGNPNSAKLILLALNPGYSGGAKGEGFWHTDERFVDKIRSQLNSDIEYPFYYLDEDPYFANSPGHKWWKRILKQLIQEIGAKELSKKICCFQLHGYHSKKYKTISLKSQEKVFQYLENLSASSRSVIVMRSKKLWEEKVKSLFDRNNLISLNNPRNPTISRNNLKQPEEFEKILSYLK